MAKKATTTATSFELTDEATGTTRTFTTTEGWKAAKVMGVTVTPEDLLADAERMKYLVDHLVATGNSSFVKEIF